VPIARTSPGMSWMPRGMRHDIALGTREMGVRIQHEGSEKRVEKEDDMGLKGPDGRGMD
jgi:hypothetical protein